ncbi:hypothetical protein DFA_02843 [Cavenderia fasciculata]|uniref:EGF-like domain-containing protein n=1 Tax=Cavenderia fasciculata TaxID=261658 RepID=F4PIM0_CACFS|nr:uncharacterized protein DFA_02843 [Cavenderia fasciculata]EGG24600.1 hypothetical protein DFA_02843 [Cavenderia fasciculata]|eukprot:XP_004362451.1 hypothetical protein DFA_02843 [Cavenderia fasciculata]
MSQLIVIVVAVLVLLLFYIGTIHCQSYPIQNSYVWPTSKGGNGHGYTVMSERTSISTTMKDCEDLSIGSSTVISYLITLDSKQEWDYVNGFWSIVWVSCRDFGGNGNYSYSSGPEINQPLFNMYTGQCWGYCPFQASDPSLAPGEEYLNTRQPAWNFKNSKGNLQDYTYSIGYIPSIGTNGGSITINNLSQFNMSTINITFFNPTKQLSKSCHITSKQGTTVTCMVPPLSGFHNVIVQDASGVSSTHYAWKPYPPFIKAVYPSFTANGSITLIGDNFGDNTNNQVFVNISTSDIPCNITFVSSTQIICQLQSTLIGNTKFLPISISVDSVYTQTYKPHIFCDNRFHSTILFGGEYSRVKQLMIDNVTMGATPNAPYIGAIESQEMYQCFGKSMDIIEKFRFWQGVSFNSNNGSFTRNNGPFKRTLSPLYYNSTVAPNMTQSNNIIYNIFDRTLSSNIENVQYYTPLITFYTSDAPIIYSVTNIMPETQSLVTINGNHFGQDLSYVLVSINESISSSIYNVTIRVAEKVTSKVGPLGKECLHNCSNHGICNRIFGSCKCDAGYGSYLDCLSLVTPNQIYNSTVVNGTSILSTNDTSSLAVVNFTIGIQFIREIDQDNSIIQTMSMDNVTWNQLKVKVQVGRSLLNCKIASRMIIDNDTIIPSRVTILPNDDPLFKQIDNRVYNLLTVFNIPQFCKSVELDPAFNGILLGADQTVGDDSYCETDPYPKWKIIMIVDLFPMPSLEWQGSGTVRTTVTISTERFLETSIKFSYIIIILILQANTIVGQDYESINKNVFVWDKSKGGNGHGYLLNISTGAISATDASALCSDMSNSKFKSYLMTLESKQEWDFIIGNITKRISSYRVWTSGSDLDSTGNYIYSSGPQTNQPLFNMYTGQCFGYCAFGSGEPSLDPSGEVYVYTRGAPSWDFNNGINNNPVGDPVLNTVCEIEPIEEVYIPSIGTNGGSITINNLSQFNIQTINITFFNPTKQLSKSCQITSKLGASVTCMVPPLSGFHNVIVQDASGVNSTHYAWQPYPPFIKAVYPSFTANGLVTLIGDNFGDNTNNIVAVNISRSNIKCNILHATSTQIICQLQSTLGDTKFLPISISVDYVYTQTYKPHIFCDNRFYSTIMLGTNFSTALQYVNDKIGMYASSNPPYIGAIETETMYQCYSQSINVQEYLPYYLWQGVSYNSNNSFTRNNGPLKGTLSPIYSVMSRNMAPGNIVYYQLDSRTIYGDSNIPLKASLIVFPLVESPVIQNVTNIQSGLSSLVTIDGNLFGQDQSYVLVSVNEKHCKSPRFIGYGFRQMTCLFDDSNESVSSNNPDFNITIRVGEKVTSKIVSLVKECPNNCSSHGICNRIFGSCKCDSGYESSSDCSVLVRPDQLFNTTIQDDGKSTLSMNETKAGIVVNFTTGIQFIREIDQDNLIVQTISMDNVTWIQDNTTSSTGESIFIGTVLESSMKLQVKVHQYKESNTTRFAGEDIQLSPNSIKYNIKITDWTWKSPINTLQVIFLSKSDSVKVDKCGRKQSKTEASFGDQILWTRVQVGRSVLNCKIASRMIIDNDTIIPSRVTILQDDDPLSKQLNLVEKQEYNMLTAFNVPRFGRSVELDPAFSALIVGEKDQINLGDDSQCSDITFEKWKIIVIVVCASFVLISITVVIVFVTKKKVQMKFTSKLNKSFQNLNRRVTQMVIPRPNIPPNQQQNNNVQSNPNNLNPVQNKISDWVSDKSNK